VGVVGLTLMAADDDGGGGVPLVGEPMVTFTLTVTVDRPSVTVNDVEYVPALKADGKLTVTVSRWTPLVGETCIHDTAGGAIDHLSDPFPSFRMLMVCEGRIVPGFPWTLIAVGETERAVWAETEEARISAATTTVKKRTVKTRISIGHSRNVSVN
jgi:hypothetical protein